MSKTKEIWTPSTLETEKLLEEQDDMATARRLVHYWWAWCVVKRAKAPLVYDMGCGSGYGCRIMVEQQEHQMKAFGMDVDDDALVTARERYVVKDGPATTEFRRVDLDTDWMDLFHNMKPTVVTCFDLFEYLDNRDLFLDALTEVLSAEGTLLLSCSTICAGVYRSKGDAKLSFSAARLKGLLKRFFGKVYQLDDDKFPSKDYLDGINEGLFQTTPPLGVDLFACQDPIRA